MESGLLETELLSPETPENTWEGGGVEFEEGRKTVSWFLPRIRFLSQLSPLVLFCRVYNFYWKFLYSPPPSFIIVDPGTTVLLVAPLQWLPAYLEKKPRETKLFLSSLNLNTKNTAQGAESMMEGGGATSCFTSVLKIQDS